MPSVRVQCNGCGRVFVPSGLSQHLSRTQDLRCRRSITQTQSATRSSPDHRAQDAGPTQVSQDLSAKHVRPEDGMFAVACRGFQGSPLSFQT